MTRIMVIGCCGAGKSTLARQIGERTGLPVIHLDQEYWQANWTETPKAEWDPKVASLANQDQWIIDGNYGGSMDVRLQKADTVVFLDRSTPVCLWRITRRILKYHGKVRPDMPPGCRERFNWEFYHYVAVFNLTRRPGILRRINALPNHVKLIRLKSDRESQQWLASLGE